MTIHYNLEDFAIIEMFRPYSPSLDERCWEAEFSNDFEKRIAGKNVKESYEAEIRKNVMKIVEMLENNEQAKRQVFGRLKKWNKWKFYEYLQHPLIDYAKTELERI